VQVIEADVLMESRDDDYHELKSLSTSGRPAVSSSETDHSVDQQQCDGNGDASADLLTTAAGTSRTWSRDMSTSSERGDAAEFEAFSQSAFSDERPAGGRELSPDCASFYFESDHVALKNNQDYRRLLRAFIALQSQRTAALSDLDQLLALQQSSLRDPLGFVSKLRRGQDLFTPSSSQGGAGAAVTSLPTIAWHKYTDDVESVLASVCLLRGPGSSTRLKQKRQLITGIRNCKQAPSIASIPTTNSTSSSARGGLSATYNQAWSSDEQRLLERLLDKYPPERFEARRYAKIAAEMPGRTTQQVTSRVQKYFIKLAKAGLPVPGRTPSLAAHGGRWLSGRLHGHHQRHSHFYFPHSTFLTSVTPPVYMTDDDDMMDQQLADEADELMVRPADDTEDLDDDVDEIAACLRDSDEYRQLMTLTALRHTRLQSTSQPSAQQVTGPVSGQHCPATSPQLSAEWSAELRFSHVDADYTSQSTGVNSYLDPNYMPAL